MKAFVFRFWRFGLTRPGIFGVTAPRGYRWRRVFWRIWILAETVARSILNGVNR